MFSAIFVAFLLITRQTLVIVDPVPYKDKETCEQVVKDVIPDISAYLQKQYGEVQIKDSCEILGKSV